MIYTVTFNPSLDYVTEVDNFILGQTNRASAAELFVGGKGINVSIMLNNLGFSSTALGFTGGFVGREIKERLNSMGLVSDFIEVEGNSRINIKLKSIDGTEINASGPEIFDKDVNLLIQKLKKCLEDDDFLILGGSVQGSVSSTVYKDIMVAVSENCKNIVVDATGDLLINALEKKPFLVKPNIHELGEIFDVELKSGIEVIEYAKKLQRMGARNVLVSMSANGAVFVSENGDIYSSVAPSGQCVSSVGSGDSMVAGFVAAWIETSDYYTAFKTGLAAGSASAFSEWIADKSAVIDVYKRTFKR